MLHYVILAATRQDLVNKLRLDLWKKRKELGAIGQPNHEQVFLFPDNGGKTRITVVGGNKRQRRRVIETKVKRQCAGKHSLK